MKITNYILALFISLVVLGSCSEDIPGTEDLNYVTFESTSLNLGVEVDGTATYDIKVYTTQVTGSDRIFNVSVVADETTADAGAYVIPGTVTVPANSNVGVLSISLSDVSLDEGNTITLGLDGEDGLFIGETLAVDVYQICGTNEVVLRILFDDWASECSWELVNASDEVVGSGGSYSDGDVSSTTSLCLDDGTYTFYIYDAYGDGMSSPGSATITLDGEELLSIEGDYGTGTSGTFEL